VAAITKPLNLSPKRENSTPESSGRISFLAVAITTCESEFLNLSASTA